MSPNFEQKWLAQLSKNMGSNLDDMPSPTSFKYLESNMLRLSVQNLQSNAKHKNIY